MASDWSNNHFTFHFKTDLIAYSLLSWLKWKLCVLLIGKIHSLKRHFFAIIAPHNTGNHNIPLVDGFFVAQPTTKKVNFMLANCDGRFILRATAIDPVCSRNTLVLNKKSTKRWHYNNKQNNICNDNIITDASSAYPNNIQFSLFHIGGIFISF